MSRSTAPVRAALAVLASVLATTALVTVTATAAHASIWQLGDGFEGPGSPWTFDGEGNWLGSFGSTIGGPRTGQSHGSIWQFDAGWSSAGRAVHLSPAVLHTANCSAQAWMVSDYGSAPVNIEVINPATWTYVALKPVSVQPGSWQRYAIGPWSARPVDVFLRFSVTSAGDVEHVKIDDVVVSCTY